MRLSNGNENKYNTKGYNNVTVRQTLISDRYNPILNHTGKTDLTSYVVAHTSSETTPP